MSRYLYQCDLLSKKTLRSTTQTWKKVGGCVKKKSVPQPMLCSLYNHVFHKVVNLASSLPVNNWAFPECPFYTQSWYYHLLPVNLEHSTIFPVFIAPVPACLKEVAAIKLRCTYIYKNQLSSWGKNIKYVVNWIYCTLFNWGYVKKKRNNKFFLPSFFSFFFFTQDSIFFVIKNHSWTVYNHFSQLGSDTAPCDPVKDKQLSNMHS